jgi:hypothetical protein
MKNTLIREIMVSRCHIQRINHQPSAHVIRHRVPDNLFVEQSITVAR